MTSGRRDRPRYAALDAARGLGVIGIGLCNAPGFANLPDLAGMAPSAGSLLDRSLWVAIQTVAQGRFVSLFSLLFGFSLLWVGGDGTDPVKNRCLARRLGSLAAIGALHGGVLWWGDILLPYAASALLIRNFRGWPPGHLLVLGFTTWLLGILLLRVDGIAALMTVGHVAHQEVAPLAWSASSSILHDCIELLSENAREWVVLLPVSILSVFLTSAPLMLIGMGLYRAGVIVPVLAKILLRAGITSGIAGMVLLLPFALMVAGLIPSWTGMSLANVAFAMVTLRLLVAPFGALLWMAVPTLSLIILRLIAPLGRMALSAYLAQSLAARLSFIFLMRSDEVPLAYGEVVLLMTLFLVAEVVFALLWDQLTNRKQGPAEVLWRKAYR